MALDAFDREVKASIDDLKAALLKDAGEEKKSAQKTDANTEQLKKLNDNLEKLEKIAGNDLTRELKALNKLTKRVAESYEEISKKRNPEKALAMTLGKVMERSQRRFGAAFSQIGKQFQKDFGERITDSINRLNPFKKMEKQGEVASNKFISSLRENWTKATKSFQDNWQALTNKIAGWEEAAINRVSKAWTDVTSFVSNRFVKVVDKMAGVWSQYMTPLLKSVAKPFKWMGSYLAPIGKAVFGTVKDLFRIGKRTASAGSGRDDLTGGPTRKEMEGEGGPVGGGGRRRTPRVAGGQSDLCRCICRCINKLLGVTKQGNRDFKTQAKNQTTLAKKVAAQAKQTGGKQGFSDPRSQMEREYAMREKLERRHQRWDERTKNVRGNITRVTSGVTGILAADNPAVQLARDFSTLSSKAAGFIASKPFEILGNLVEKQQIFGTNVAGLGPIIKFFGEALGGLAQGLVQLVLAPLAEEVGNFQEEVQAMYITRGSVGGGAGNFGDANNVLANAKGVGNIATKEAQIARSAEEVTLTGQRYEKIQRQQLANLRRGIRDETQLNKVHHIGLRTASQIGANAEQTAEMFADWKQSLGASNIQLSQMERGLLGIARTTGVFGDNLLRAANASKSFMEYMRQSGTYTAKSANNIIGLMVEAEKRGVSQGMGNVLQVLQGSLLGQGGDEKSRNLAIAGIGGSERARSRMMSGTLLQDRGAMKTVSQNWEARLNNIAMKRFGKSIDRLSIEQKGLLDPMIRDMFGKGVEELSQIIQSFKERSKSFSDRMVDLDNGTNRGLKADEINNQRQQLVFDTGAEILEDFNRALKEEGGDVGAAFEKIRKSSEDLAPFMNKFSIDIEKGGDSIGDVLRKQAEMVRERAKQQGLTSDVNAILGDPKAQEEAITKAMADLQAGNRQSFDDLQAKMAAVEGKTREQMRQNADPVTKIVTMLFKVEAHLRIISRSILNAIAPGIQDFMGHIDGVMDKAAVEFAKGTPEGKQEAVRIIGEALGKLPEEISKHTKTISGADGVPGIWKGMMGGADMLLGEGSPLGQLQKTIGQWIERNSAKISEFLFDIEVAIDKLKMDIGGLVKDILWWAGVITAGGVVAVAITGLVGLLTGAGGLVGALGGVAGAVGIILKAAGAVALPAVAAGGILAVKNHAENVNQKNREQSASSNQLMANFAAEFKRQEDARRSSVEGMSMQQVKDAIAMREKNVAHYQAGHSKIKTRYSGWDDLSGRSKVWEADKKNFQDAANLEMKAIGELRNKLLKLSIAELQPKQLEEYLARVQKGETFNIPKFGQIGKEDIPGATTILKEAVEKAKAAPAAAPGTMTPMLPNTGANMQDEARRKKAEAQNAEKDTMSGIESNTGATAAGTRAMVKMLGQIGRMLSKNLKNSGLGGIGPDAHVEAFFDEVLSTEWVNARIGRKATLEIDSTDVN